MDIQFKPINLNSIWNTLPTLLKFIVICGGMVFLFYYVNLKFGVRYVDAINNTTKQIEVLQNKMNEVQSEQRSFIKYQTEKNTNIINLINETNDNTDKKIKMLLPKDNNDVTEKIDLLNDNINKLIKMSQTDYSIGVIKL